MENVFYLFRIIGKSPFFLDNLVSQGVNNGIAELGKLKVALIPKRPISGLFFGNDLMMELGLSINEQSRWATIPGVGQRRLIHIERSDSFTKIK